ncbi:MAG TPA: GntR family transcriptional regulator [Savagea sp.]
MQYVIDEWRQVSRSEQIAEAIWYRIFSGHFQEGERLNELQLMHEYEADEEMMSEALYLLQQSGVVTRATKKGVFVREVVLEEMNDYLEVFVWFTEASFDRAIVKWESSHQLVLYEYFEKMADYLRYGDMFRYVRAFTAMAELIVELGGNVAAKRFFQQTTFLTNAVAQIMWKPEKLGPYHDRVRQFVQLMASRQYEEAKHVLLSTLRTSFSL